MYDLASNAQDTEEMFFINSINQSGYLSPLKAAKIFNQNTQLFTNNRGIVIYDYPGD